MSEAPDAPLWVFAYGSLMWAPEMPLAEALPAAVEGWRRSFCMWSIHHRGTPDAPGLVLALDRAPGARCEGLALRVAPGCEAEALARLRARELVSSAYVETRLETRLADGRRVRALGYVVDPAHEQYCGGLPLPRQAEVIARARGGRGANAEYLFNTVAHLRELGIREADLEWLAREVAARTAAASGAR